MDPSNHLRSLLQIQLASDASAVRHLPYCLWTLTAECLQASPQLTKWTTRIHSLLHSKESGGRWAGLCLAYKSSMLSQSLMIDAANSWIGVALPILSRSEPIPTVKAAVRLLRVIFSTAINIPEFHRQVSLPHVVKFTSALIPLADNSLDIELKTLCMETLTRLIPLYPTTHRASSTALSAFALRYLNGSLTGFTNESILKAASQLYSVLPLTGGKVGAVNLWRKALDETLAFGWEAFHGLRTTFLLDGKYIERRVDEPQIAIPLNQDRLRCSIVILNDLLNTAVERFVQIPVGNLVKFIASLLTSSAEEEVPGFVDPTVHAMEVAMIPDIWKAGCELLVCVATRFPHRLDTNAGRLLSILAYHLEQNQSAHYRLPLIEAVNALLKNSYPLHSSVLPSRLSKAMLPSITKIVASSSTASADTEPSSSKSKNSKKRARNYEGDEIFKTTRQVICATVEDEQILLASLDVLKSLFSNSGLSPPLQSLVARVITTVLVTLLRTSPSSISQDLSFIHILNAKIQDFSLMIGSGTTSVMSKTLPFVIESALTDSGSYIQRDIALLLHPRVPPLVRSMPHLEALSLFRAEQSQEETDLLAALGVKVAESNEKEAEHQDVVMTDEISTTAPTSSNPINLSVINAPATTAVQPTLTPVIPPQPQVKFVDETVPSHNLHSGSDKEAVVVTPAISRFESINFAAPKATSSQHLALPIPQDEADDDEEMPAINMDSDSDDE